MIDKTCNIKTTHSSSFDPYKSFLNFKCTSDITKTPDYFLHEIKAMELAQLKKEQMGDRKK